MTWPMTILIVGLAAVSVPLIATSIFSWSRLRESKLTAEHEDALRQLVQRYEQLAENTMDAQQRIAADVAELRARTGSIEQILRTVE